MLIPLASLIVKKRQRSSIDPGQLNELRDSILKLGNLHPPVASYDPGSGIWTLIAGERRLQAIRKIAEDGLCYQCGSDLVPPGEIWITNVNNLNEASRFEAELDENLRREDISWQDRVTALAALHKMRLVQNSKHTITATAAEVLGKSPDLSSQSHVRATVSDAITIAEHLHDPAIEGARNALEAMSLILKKEERVRAELIKRRLITMEHKPSLEVRHADLTLLLPLLEAASFDLILADPPYGIDASSAGFRARTVFHHNYEDSPEAARSIAESILTEGFRLAKNRANIFMFGAIETFDWWKRSAANTGWVPFNRPLIWQKSQSEGLAPWGAQGPRITTEFIFYATKGQRGLVASPIDVFEIKRVPRSERIHAAEKPVELLKALIECSTLPGEAVLDPCCGSGSTLVACREAKRTGLGIEKDETYFNTALTNVHHTTGAEDAKVDAS